MQPAWLLHARPYRETSQIAELFSRDFGRVAVVMRGVRGTRRAGNAPRQFVPLLVGWSGRAAMKSMRGHDANGPAPQLRGETLLAGLYLNELLLRVLKPLDAHEALFELYGRTLHALQEGDALAASLRCFEKALLVEIGYGVSFSHAADDGRPLQPGVRYAVQPDLGFVSTAAVPGIRPEETLSGQELLRIDRDDYSRAATRDGARRLFRRLLEPHLGGYPLQSSRLLASSRRREGREND